MMKKMIIVFFVMFVAACGKSDSSVGSEAVKVFFNEHFSVPSAVEVYDVKYKLIACNEDTKVTSNKVAYYTAVGEVEVYATALVDLPKFSVVSGDKIKMLNKVYLEFSRRYKDGEYSFYGSSNIEKVGLGKI